MREEATSRLIFDRLTRARRPILVAHKKPDGDTLGSVMAVYNFLRDRGGEAYPFCVDHAPKVYSFIPRIRDLTSNREIFKDEAVDLICVFDASDLKYAGIDEIVAGMGRKLPMIEFDHHLSHDGFADINLVDPKASSTSEVVHRFFRASGVPLTRGIAAGLMAGVLTDTSNFSNPATTPESLEMAADLLIKGASVQDITRRITRSKSFDALKLWGKALERLRRNTVSGHAVTALFREDLTEHKADEEDLEGLSNFLNRFLASDVVLVLKELPDGKVKGSLRSASDVDVAEIARKFGGGGHRKAAGFTLAGKIVEDPVEGWKVA